MRNNPEQIDDRVEIYPAAQGDAEGIVAVQREGWIATYANDAIGITRELLAQRYANYDERVAKWRKAILASPTSADRRIWVAKAGPKVVGYCAPVKFADNRGRLGGLYVLSAYQGTGVASQLIQLAFDWFGDRPMDLEVVSYNARALAFYKKFAFVEGGVTEGIKIGDHVLPLIKMRRG